MHPVLFHIGPMTFYSFGLMAALSLLVPGFFVVYPLLKRHGVRFADRLVLEIIIAAGVGGFVGARIYYMFQHLSDVRHDVWGSIFTGSGFTWYGGLIGGILAVVVLCLVRRAPLGLMSNIVAPAVALGYAIGRVGCQLAGDGDYGKPSHLPWAMGYPHGTVPTPPGVRVQPTPIYEILHHAPRRLGALSPGAQAAAGVVRVRLVPGALRAPSASPSSSCAATPTGCWDSRSRSG